MPINLEHILKRVRDLPPLPLTATQLISLTKNPKTSAKDLEVVISQDPSLTAGILRQANSSYYGYARRISSLQEAIVLLGFQVIQGIAMSTAIAPLLKIELVGYEIDQEGLWKHSLLTGMAAKRLCQHRKLPYADIAFTAGLLHDIGKLIISIYVREVSDYLLKKASELKLSYVELEGKVIGFDHAKVGGLLAESWNLPDDLVEAITYHHSPASAQNHEKLTSVIHVANGLVGLLGIGGGVDSLYNPIERQALDLLTLKEADLKLIMVDLSKSLSHPSLFSE